MIVDDDEDIRHVLRLLLEFEDFELAAAACTGVEALALAVEHKPDFIILDYMMPGMAGDETAARLRTLVPNACIIAFSAILDGRPAWADAFLIKDRISELVPLLSNLAPRSGRA